MSEQQVRFGVSHLVNKPGQDKKNVLTQNRETIHTVHI